ncbi:MAG TPA: hypothetical protein VHV51_13755, partial [Polyangiaceae bacterium]|nr:hypothetical protein [Polyangiaceae bacterium]
MRLKKAFCVFAAPLLAAACSSQDPSASGENVDQTASELKAAPPPREQQTASPIKHVIVIIGENRTFDHVFATYKPKRGEQVSNLLSKRIIKDDGSPGPNFDASLQKSAVDSQPDGYRLSPRDQKPYDVLPPPLAGGP